MAEKKSCCSFWMEIFSLVLLMEFLFLTTGYQNGTVGKWHFALLLGAVCLHVISHELSIRAGKLGTVRQLSVLNMGIAVIFLVLSLRGKALFEFWGRKSYFFSCLAIAVAYSGLWIRGFYCCRGERKRRRKEGKAARENSGRNFGILLVLLVVCAIAVWNSSAEVRWDSAYIYKSMRWLNITALFNINDLSFCNHISMSYMAINLAAGILFGSLRLGMTVLNIGLYLGSVWCVYLILRMHTGAGDREAALLSTVYAFSPFLLGLVNYNYWDYWVVVLFPIVVYFAMSKKWVYYLFFSMIFCFVKETAVVAYAFLCLGLLLADFIQMIGSGEGIWNCLKRLLGKKEYFGMLALGIGWLYIYIKLPNWDGAGAFAFDWDYILDKLAVFYGLNFNWLLTLVGVILFLFLVKSRKKDFFGLLLPLLCSDTGFVVFSCLFQTVNHARYIDAHIAALNLIVVVALAALGNKILKYGMTAVLAGIMLISNYRTVDPVTLHLFEKHDVGKTVIVSTARGEYISDSIVYNQQYMCLDRILNKAMADIVAEEDTVICFPAMNDSSWFFDGSGDWDSMNNGMLVKGEYWDLKKKKRTAYETDDCIFMLIFQLSMKSDLREIIGDKTGYYFYLPEVGEDIYNEIVESMCVLEEQTFEYQGWVLSRIKFSSGQTGE